MARCIEIAKNAMGTAAPNPMVGAILVYQDRIIGEGYTSPFGGPHAEVNAIRAVKDETLLAEATLYVTLEPCSHHGKTPPCADLITRMGIPRVVIGIMDPNERVAGKGIRRLREGGCEVLTGVLHAQCREHHRRFLTFHEGKRPYVILKWAESSDGFLAPEKGMRKRNPEPYWITSRTSRQLVHKWRSEEQAILVGANTVLDDDPSLTTRLWQGNNPVRIVLDRSLKIPRTCRVYDEQAPTLVFTSKSSKAFPSANVELVDIPQTDFEAGSLLTILWQRDIISVIVEGGKQTLDLFLDSGLWDEARIFMGAARFGSGLKAPIIDRCRGHQLHIVSDQLTLIRND